MLFHPVMPKKRKRGTIQNRGKNGKENGKKITEKKMKKRHVASRVVVSRINLLGQGWNKDTRKRRGSYFGIAGEGGTRKGIDSENSPKTAIENVFGTVGVRRKKLEKWEKRTKERTD